MTENTKIFHKGNQVRLVYPLFRSQEFRFTLVVGTLLFLFVGIAFELFFLWPLYSTLFYVASVFIVFRNYKRRETGVLTIGYSTSGLVFQKYSSNLYGRYAVSFELESLRKIEFFESNWKLVFTSEDHVKMFKIDKNINLSIIGQMLDILNDEISTPCDIILM